MFNLPLSFVIEALVAILLVITIGYCMLLNSRLKRLRADEEGLRATISELLTATEIAERAIQGLRSTSAQCDQTLGQRLHEAAHVSESLGAKLSAAGAVIERIGKLAGATGVPVSAPVPAPRSIKTVPEKVVTSPAPADTPSRRLDDAARALQGRLEQIAS